MHFEFRTVTVEVKMLNESREDHVYFVNAVALDTV